MALRKATVVLFTSRCLTLLFGVAAMKTFVYDPTHPTTPVPLSVLSILNLALLCHVTTCIVELGGLVVSVLKDWNPLPGDRGLRFSVIFLDLVLACFTSGSAIAAVSVATDFGRARIIVHASLACVAGYSGFVTAFYPYWISVPRQVQVPLPHA